MFFIYTMNLYTSVIKNSDHLIIIFFCIEVCFTQLIHYSNHLTYFNNNLFH